eukprot:1774440-Alexandrium_andersonii.AAC.1
MCEDAFTHSPEAPRSGASPCWSAVAHRTAPVWTIGGGSDRASSNQCGRGSALGQWANRLHWG